MRHTRRTISDPDQFGDAVSGMSLTVEFQRRQVRPSHVEQFQTPEWALDFGEAHVKTSVRGVLPDGWASLLFAHGPGGAIWNGQACTPGTLCCVPPGEGVEGHTMPNFGWMTVALPPSLWAQCRALAGVSDSKPHGFTACPLPSRLAATIEQQVQTTHALLRTAAKSKSDSHAHANAARLAMHLATTACEFAARMRPPRESLRNRTRLARRAEAWMRERLAESIQVPDICLALGVSRRELEYAFRNTFDQSPRDFLHAVRMNAIRRTLLRTEPRTSILDVLLDHGLTHPGRFAADYRALFGERPSETRRG